MPPSPQTFYEILGIGRNAKATDITRAYARIRAEMQKETTAPNPRLAAMAKVAHETLSNPERRAEYDASLGIIGRPAGKGRGGMLAISLAAAVVAIAGAGYWFFARSGGPAQPPPQSALGPQEILQAVAPHLGHVQAALMSGEVRDLGTALAIGDAEMVTTCRGIAAGMQLTVKMEGFAAKAEVARAHEELDICTLTVKGAAAGIKVRQGTPAAGEKLQAVFAGPGAPQARQVAIAAAIADPKGAALEVKAGAPLPNGAALFDSQARLVGIVVAPHAYGEGKVAALGATRIAQARGAASPPVAAAPAAAPMPAATTPAAAASPAEAAVPLPPPATRRGGRGTLVEEGFSSLWREDSEGRLVEVLDNIKKADVGNPLAYWTRWTGRDSASPQVVHCRITYGAEESIVVDDDQISDQYPADGYWYCAFTRFQVELDQIPEGQYQFTIFVNRDKVAESSIRVEKRFFTRGTYAVIVVVVGLLLLAFLRRNKVAGRG